MLWYLESRAPESRLTTCRPLNPLPFRIGRRWDLPLPLSSPLISWEHAEISQGDEGLEIRDLGSTNGTFVNGKRVTEPTRLAEGDILHIAVVELRLGRTSSPEELRQPTADLSVLPRSFVEQSVYLSEMMRIRAVECLFQPIAALKQRALLGFEALSRGRHQRLPRSPVELLEIAQRLGAAAELSHLFRVCSLETARELARGTRLFANSHPTELQRPSHFLRRLGEIRDLAPEQPLTLEVHEQSIADLAALRSLRSSLTGLDIQIAYDDFGAGQSRLLEIAEVPPDVLKFDASLTRGIDKAPAARHTLLASMLRMAEDLGITTVAEGVETRAELETCRQLGFDGAQGYFCGIPAPAFTFGAEADPLDSTHVMAARTPPG